MTKTLIKYSCVLSVALAPAAGWAGSPTFATSNSGVSSSTTTTTSTTGSTSSGATGTSSSTSGSSGTVAGADSGVETSGGSTPSVKDSADQSSSANKGAKATQVLTGAMMFVMAAQQYSSQNYAMAAVFTGFGILSMMQGKEHGSAAGSAGLTSFQSDGLGTNPYDYSDPSEYDAELEKDSSVKAISQNMKTLTSGGIYDPKTGKIKTPDGKTYKASDFSSAASMAAAGIPKGAILGAVDAYDQVHKKAISKVEKMKLGALTASNGYAEGGGGGGMGAGVGSEDPGAAGGAYGGAGGGGAGLGINRDPSALAGMQKNYNGEPIGVAADSIFLMMTRRYKVKESQESFYTDAELALQK